MNNGEPLRFVGLAQPHAWLMTADNLHDQARALYRQRGRERLVLHQRDQPSLAWDSTDRAVFLMGAFALENALKAFLVYENPSWISNGRLSRHLRSHSLTTLQGLVRDIPYKRRYRWVLQEFEAGIESWARYPCALTAEETDHPSAMPGHLWAGYLAVTSAYRRRLCTLLRRPWSGPHGFHGEWEIRNDFFELGNP